MCSNYRSVTRRDRLLSFFGVERGLEEAPSELVFPTGVAPFIRRATEGASDKVVADGHFGLLPPFAKELAYGRRTYNARSETVGSLPSFRDAWRMGQRCIVPAEAIFEPCYESGKAVRWCIQQPGEVPMGIAGVWQAHPRLKGHDGQPLLSFAMLTVNADGHPVFKRMHRPGDEKRMVVIVDPAEYDRWLFCSTDEASTFFRPWTGPLDAFSAPLERPPRFPPPDEPPAQAGLF